MGVAAWLRDPVAVSALEERADADLVAVGVGEHGERRRFLVVDDLAAGRDTSGYALLGHVGRYPEVDVEALPRRLVRVGVLEPEDRNPPTRIANVVTLP